MFNERIEGIYEQLISKIIELKLKNVDINRFFIKDSIIDKSEAAKLLSQYLSEVINRALSLIPDNSIEQQIEVSNKIIRLLRDELKDVDFEERFDINKWKNIKCDFFKIGFKCGKL